MGAALWKEPKKGLEGDSDGASSTVLEDVEDVEGDGTARTFFLGSGEVG